MMIVAILAIYLLGVVGAYEIIMSATLDPKPALLSFAWPALFPLMGVVLLLRKVVVWMGV